jgi:hypothetical protein
MGNTVANIEDIPAGYFRIHWPQSQVLMDYPDYDGEVIHCIDDAAKFHTPIHDEVNLPTVALPLRWMSIVEKELGQKTKTYIQFINQKYKLN